MHDDDLNLYYTIYLDDEEEGPNTVENIVAMVIDIHLTENWPTLLMLKSRGQNYHRIGVSDDAQLVRSNRRRKTTGGKAQWADQGRFQTLFLR